MTDDLADDLQAFLSEPTEDGWDLNLQPEGWHPATSHDADRLLRGIRRHENELAEIKALAGAEIKRIREWAEDRAAGPERQIAAAELAVEGWARAEHRASKGRTVTWTLPNGTLRLRPGRQSLVVDDEAETVAFLIEVGAESLIKREVRRTELKRQVGVIKPSHEETEGVEDAGREHWLAVYQGAIVPGVHLETPALPTFTQSAPKADSPDEQMDAWKEAEDKAGDHRG